MNAAMDVARRAVEMMPTPEADDLARVLAPVAALVAEGAPRESIADAFDGIAPSLDRLPSELVAGIRTGLRTDAWDDAVAAFGRMADQRTAFYLGPMIGNEGDAPSMGLVLLSRAKGVLDIADHIEANVGPIGEIIFGEPCNFHGRHVELYDVDVAAGPVRRANGKSIALFTPFYLSGWNDLERQVLLRRSILFLNVVRKRFETITRPLLEKHGALVDGKRPAVLDASREELDRAITLWLTLHELVHGSGPVPLFGSPVGKLALDGYSGLEEMRTDMTVWTLLDAGIGAFEREAVLAQEIIVAERLLRSARDPRTNPKAIPMTPDGRAGALWAEILQRSGAVAHDGHLAIDRVRLADGLREVLAELYEVEGEAAAEAEQGAIRLSAFADRMNERLFERVEGELAYSPAVDTLLKAFGSPAVMDLQFVERR